jgi:hypothetical protein
VSRVTLTPYEIRIASTIGVERQVESVLKRRKDAFGFEGLGWSEHIEGAMGELAVAKTLDVHWGGPVNVFKGDDLPGIQVRTRSSHGWQLYVRPGDSDEAIWILVTGRCPDYWVRGWIVGWRAKRREWLQNHGGRPPAYFVPTDQLRPLPELFANPSTVVDQVAVGGV